MKKYLLLSLTISLALALTACGGSGPNSAANNDPEAVINGDIKGEITVSCFDTMIYEKFLQEAAELFELKHPGIKINIDAFSKMPEVKTRELEDGSVVAVTEGNDEQETLDYIHRLSTRLMGGQGPDIMAMDVLPYYKYAESGMLEDLRVYMEADADFAAGAYRQGIIEGVRYKGGQYIMPLDFDYQFISLFRSDK